MPTLALLTPQRSVWTLALLLALGIAAGVYRVPIQVSDSLELLERVNATPTIGSVLDDALSSSPTMLRPLRQVQSKVLLEVAELRGVGHTRAFRGFHALAAAALVLLFVAALGCQSWPDVAAAMFALMVLTGLHTTAGMLREAYPINHFLLIAIYALLVLHLSRSRGGAAVDIAAVACFVLAALTLESGILILPLAAASHIAGQRGVSRRGIAAMSILAAAYVYMRVGYLDIAGPALGERPVGFGLGELDEAAIRTRFADMPFLLSAYTIVNSVLTVLLSQPINGTWTAVRSWLDGSLQAFQVIAVSTSTFTTVLVGWYVFKRGAMGRRLFEPVPVMMITLLAGSALLSYAYAKSEIMSAAGVFYALVVFHAAKHLLSRAPQWKPATRQAVVFLMMLSSAAWAFRAMGLQYQLERSAFLARNEWVHREEYSLDAYTGTPLESSLRRQALRRDSTNPHLMPRVFEDLWGTE